MSACLSARVYVYVSACVNGVGVGDGGGADVVSWSQSMISGHRNDFSSLFSSASACMCVNGTSIEAWGAHAVHEQQERRRREFRQIREFSLSLSLASLESRDRESLVASRRVERREPASTGISRQERGMVGHGSKSEGEREEARETGMEGMERQGHRHRERGGEEKEGKEMER